MLILNKSIEEQGIAANLGFVLGLSVGRLLPAETFGAAVTDADGLVHPPLTNLGHYVRSANPTKLATLRAAFEELPDVVVHDYTDDAGPADYAAYTAALESHGGDEVTYRAIHVFGPADEIVPLTKNLSRA